MSENTETAVPCPFCGVALTQAEPGLNFRHADNDCFIGETTIPLTKLARWNQRAGTPIECVPVKASAKELTWKVFCPETGSCDAETPFGNYVVQAEDSRTWKMWIPGAADEEVEGTYTTRDDAIAAAQSDFKKRVEASIGSRIECTSVASDIAKTDDLETAADNPVATVEIVAAATHDEPPRVRVSRAVAELANAGLELASYASYAEIIGAIGHNRAAVRKWCDKVFRFNAALEKELDACGAPSRWTGDISLDNETDRFIAYITQPPLQEDSELGTRCVTYDEILRTVCHHLEIPHSESGPCDDVRVYDRALSAADEYTKKADADLAVNRKARFAAEAEVERLRVAADHIAPYLRWTIGPESAGHHPTMPSAVAAFHVAFDIDTKKKRMDRLRGSLARARKAEGDNG